MSLPTFQTYLPLFTSIICGIGDLTEQLSLILLVYIPLSEPCIQLLELWLQLFEQSAQLDEAQDGLEDIEANFIVRGQKVEDSCQNAQSKTGTVGGGGGDGLGEVVANAGEEHVDAGGLNDEIDKQIVCGSELLLGGGVEGGRGGNESLEGVILLVLIEEGLDFVSNIEVLGQFLRKVCEGAVDEDLLNRGRHLCEIGSYAPKPEFCFVEDVRGATCCSTVFIVGRLHFLCCARNGIVRPLAWS